MFIAMNRFKVIEEERKAFEDLWVTRQSHLDEVMNVHQSAGVNPPGPTTADPFAPEALYELKIDTDGDAVADIAYRVRFSASEGGMRAVYQGRQRCDQVDAAVVPDVRR